MKDHALDEPRCPCVRISAHYGIHRRSDPHPRGEERLSSISSSLGETMQVHVVDEHATTFGGQETVFAYGGAEDNIEGRAGVVQRALEVCVSVYTAYAAVVG